MMHFVKLLKPLKCKYFNKILNKEKVSTLYGKYKLYTYYVILYKKKKNILNLFLTKKKL